ncbi:hypothetical protein VHUM_01614 [Vanrija humicola]|uniref:Mob1/phocein n=1 Tax=Vanrija humicola TaxID=5417 RepID=A0A7D8Z639_VANHU|nr:hypothetical protein VHUM_01614 [Vanrija humicola]
MPPLPPQTAVPPLSSFDGPFQVAEYLSLKVRHDPHDVKGLVEVPTDNAKAADRHVWIYEHLRRIPIDVTPLMTQLLQLCSRESCPEMKADEWQYLCVAHGGEGTDRCCAIDYILHTLDSTTALLNSSNYFPSRLQIPHASLAHFPSLFRRLSRIFSHAYFHHREAFATSEAETSLYARFVALCQRYELVGQSLLIIPPEGYEVVSQHDDEEDEEEEEDEDDHDAEDHEVAEHDSDEERQEATDGTEPSLDDNSPPRGREFDNVAGRSHSLDRHPVSLQSPGKWTTGSPVQPANKGKPAPAQASDVLSPPSGTVSLNGLDEDVVPPTTQTKGRNTLSRGKTPRATTVWTSGAGSSPPKADTIAEAPLSRTESIDTIVHIGPESDDEGATAAATEEASTAGQDSPTARSPSKSASPPKDDSRSLMAQAIKGRSETAGLSSAGRRAPSPAKGTSTPPALDTITVLAVKTDEATTATSTLLPVADSANTSLPPLPETAPCPPAPALEEDAGSIVAQDVPEQPKPSDSEWLSPKTQPAPLGSSPVKAPLLGSFKPRARSGSNTATAFSPSKSPKALSPSLPTIPVVDSSPLVPDEKLGSNALDLPAPPAVSASPKSELLSVSPSTKAKPKNGKGKPRSPAKANNNNKAQAKAAAGDDNRLSVEASD